jgi:hypothetical protein
VVSVRHEPPIRAGSGSTRTNGVLALLVRGLFNRTVRTDGERGDEHKSRRLAHYSKPNPLRLLPAIGVRTGALGTLGVEVVVGVGAGVAAGAADVEPPPLAIGMNSVLGPCGVSTLTHTPGWSPKREVPSCLISRGVQPRALA